jgi:hypothetical protein
MAHQFIAAVGSSNLAFSMKPFTSDVNELLQFIIKYEIMETVHNGSYAGTNGNMLQLC